MSGVNRNQLLKVLNMAKAAIYTKDYLPILSHFLFSSKDEAVTAYNDILAINIGCDADIDGCVPAELLIKTLNSLAGDTVLFTKHDGHLLVTSGKSKIKLPILPAADFPDPLPVGGKLLGKFSVTTEMLTGITACLVAVGTDSDRPALMGVTLSYYDEDSIALYSTDNVSISRYTLASDLELPADAPIILPTDFCRQLLALSKLTDEIEVGIYSGALVASFGNAAVLFTKTLVDVNPMDFDEVVAKYVSEDKLKMLDVPEAFESSFERALLIQSNEPYKSTVVTVKNKVLTLESTCSKGEVTDEMSFAGEDVNFAVDPVLVRRMSGMADKVAMTRKVMVFASKDQSFMHLVAHRSV